MRWRHHRRSPSTGCRGFYPFSPPGRTKPQMRARRPCSPAVFVKPARSNESPQTGFQFMSRNRSLPRVSRRLPHASCRAASARTRGVSAGTSRQKTFLIMGRSDHSIDSSLRSIFRDLESKMIARFTGELPGRHLRTASI